VDRGAKAPLAIAARAFPAWFVVGGRGNPTGAGGSISNFSLSP